MCTESIQILDVSISPFHHQRIQPLWRFFCGVPMLPVNGQPFLLRACVLTSIGHIMAYIFWYIHWLVIWSFLEMKLIAFWIRLSDVLGPMKPWHIRFHESHTMFGLFENPGHHMFRFWVDFNPTDPVQACAGDTRNVPLEVFSQCFLFLLQSTQVHRSRLRRIFRQIIWYRHLSDASKLERQRHWCFSHSQFVELWWSLGNQVGAECVGVGSLLSLRDCWYEYIPSKSGYFKGNGP